MQPWNPHDFTELDWDSALNFGTDPITFNSNKPPITSSCNYNFYLVSDPEELWHNHAYQPHENCIYCEHNQKIYEALVGYTITTKTEKQKGRPIETPETEYAFTITMPPDFKPKKPLTEITELILTHGRSSKPHYETPISWAYVLEHTSSGTPHIHGVYKTPKGHRIEQKYFKRYWPLWDEKIKLGHGHQGGYHQKARHNECYAAYILKEGDVKSFPPKDSAI